MGDCPFKEGSLPSPSHKLQERWGLGRSLKPSSPGMQEAVSGGMVAALSPREFREIVGLTRSTTIPGTRGGDRWCCFFSNVSIQWFCRGAGGRSAPFWGLKSSKTPHLPTNPAYVGHFENHLGHLARNRSKSVENTDATWLEITRKKHCAYAQIRASRSLG